MTGYCPDCGNTLCICPMVAADLSARGAANPQTIREHLSEIRDLADMGNLHLGRLEQISNHSLDAIELLDKALRASDGDRNWWLADTKLGTHRLVADPDTHCGSEVTDRVSVPDPAPRGDAEPDLANDWRDEHIERVRRGDFGGLDDE